MNSNWATKYYGPGGGVNIGNPPHNCTLYAAWMLARNGVSDPGRTWGNARDWGHTLASMTNGTPAVGSIAWFDAGRSGVGSFGHVGYVAQVNRTNGTVFVESDNYLGGSAGYTSSGWISISSPSGYIHVKDLATPANDLWFIKTRNTGSGHVEVHNATAASGYSAATVHAATWFGTGDQSNGWFQMVGNDLWFIKTRNTGSGHVEVHNATAASGYSAATVHAATWFGTGDQSNGYFQMVGNDLWFIKTRNTGSGHVEVHTATAATGYQSGAHYVTWLGTGDQNNGWFQIVGNDLWFIKTKNTGSGHVEVHNATAASGYSAATVHAASWLGSGDQGNGWFQMVGNDLWFIKTKNTGSGHVEVHNATAASGYSAATVHAASWLGSGDQGNGWFQLGSKY